MRFARTYISVPKSQGAEHPSHRAPESPSTLESQSTHEHPSHIPAEQVDVDCWSTAEVVQLRERAMVPIPQPGRQVDPTELHGDQKQFG